MANVALLRVFISSPGDVLAEREAAKRVISGLPDRPAFRDRVALRIVSWSETKASTPLLSHLTPQEAINEGLPRPSECDIVVVILWSRLGTPFQDRQGRTFQSGTHWELLDAVESGHPATVIYWCTRPVSFSPDDEQSAEQFRALQAFKQSPLFTNEGLATGGVNEYESLNDFREMFETHFEALVLRRLGGPAMQTLEAEPSPATETQETVRSSLWEGSPFPGLRSFTPADAPIYFGREHAVDLLTAHVASTRFLAVVGNSGSGKSSLVSAGLIPRLSANEIHDERTGSKDWFIAKCTPGKNPFEALAAAVMRSLPRFDRTDPIDFVDRSRRLAEYVRQDPSYLIPTIEHALQDEVAWSEVVLFIDQFEELFSMQSEELIKEFVACISEPSSRVRVVVTLRSDFYGDALDYLGDLLRTGTFTLSPPSEIALHQMIVRPAERAALAFDPGLPERLVEDTGNEPGALPLLAYALDELYSLCTRDGRRWITFDDYHSIGGVQGVIATRADAVLQALPLSEERRAEVLQDVFTNLVAVDESGTAVRRRVAESTFGDDPEAHALIDRLVEARLLVHSAGDDGTPLLEVAHEALFSRWEPLARCIERVQDDLILLRQLTNAANEWDRRGRNDAFLWSNEILTIAYEMLRRLHDPELPDNVREFIRPERDRLLEELYTKSPDHRRRATIGQRIDQIGDHRKGVECDATGLPDIDWLPVGGGKRIFADREVQIPPFWIAKYPVTHAQFQAFQEEMHDEAWWKGLDAGPDGVLTQQSEFGNHPRDSARWADAVAFSRWLTARLAAIGAEVVPGVVVGSSGWQVRLPLEWEWQLAAESANGPSAFPWGDTWRETFTNTREANLSQTTAVGMYPEGASGVGALDMSGNIYEWCLNQFDDPWRVGGTGSDRHVRRGGSCNHDHPSARNDSRFDESMTYRLGHDMGFRVVLAMPPQPPELES